MKRLMGVELNNGVQEKHWLHSEGGEKKITIHRVQDAEPILKKNREQFNCAPSNYGKSEMQKVASIPAVVLEQACAMHGLKFAELMDCKTDRAKKIWNELLNGRDFKGFRTRPGVVKVNGN